MTTIEFKRFTDIEVLKSVPPKYLAAFFDRFKDQIEPRYLPANHDLPGTGGFYDTWIQTLKMPHVLPQPLIDAILSIEELASVENRPLLDAKVTEARVANPHLDPKDSPECLALRLWLLSAPDKKRQEVLASNQPSSIAKDRPPAILPTVKIDSD